MSTAGIEDRPIGLFDSGVGGLSVLRALRAELPGEAMVYFADSGHAPYGERSDAFVAQRALAITGQLREKHHIKALVVACNTATAAAIGTLRAAHPDLPIVGVEPALKPAAHGSRTRRIGVMATRGTLASRRFQTLRASLHGEADFVLQACDGLAHAIETFNTTKTIALCADYTGAMGTFGLNVGDIDTLVLGCTHYPFASAHLQALLGPEVRLMDTGAPVARQTRLLLQQSGQLKKAPTTEGLLTLLSTGDLAGLRAATTRWL